MTERSVESQEAFTRAGCVPTASAPVSDAHLSNPQLEVIYYTDPLCSWSWAFETQWRRLCCEFAGRLNRRFVMGGLIADWQHFSDPLNDISRPAQMGPHWLQVRQLAGMPIDERIWHEDPPASSYPACIAVKAAAQQGQAIAEAYLRRLREAVMLERRNITRQEVLLSLAEELAAPIAGTGGLDLAQFRNDLQGQNALNTFREDLKDVQYRGIGRFPTLVLRPTSGSAVIIVGYRPYQALREALAHVAPTITPVRSTKDLDAYVACWRRITARELAEALDLETNVATQMLEAAVEQGSLARAGYLYYSTATTPTTPLV